MARIYKNQENLRIQLTTGVSIAGATIKQIKYKKPDKSTSYWSAEEGDATTGVIYYDVKKTANGADIDQIGIWKLWAFITFADGRSAIGNVVRMRVYPEGT